MISIGLNLILGMLLMCALMLGMRLEKRLRGLRESHTDFAKAVGELDQAAARTETSLAALRSGTEQAKDELASRIDQARIACQRLEKLSADAERIANQPLALSQPIERMVPPPLTQTPVGASALARPAPEAPRPPAPAHARAIAQPPPVRSRAKLIDDDLFAAAPPPPRRPQPAFAEAQPAPAPLVIHADNDPLVGGVNPGARMNDRSAREAFYREVLDRESFTPDPFESGSFARERRAMLSAVMGGRR